MARLSRWPLMSPLIRTPRGPITQPGPAIISSFSPNALPTRCTTSSLLLGHFCRCTAPRLNWWDTRLMQPMMSWIKLYRGSTGSGPSSAVRSDTPFTRTSLVELRSFGRQGTAIRWSCSDSWTSFGAIPFTASTSAESGQPDRNASGTMRSGSDSSHTSAIKATAGARPVCTSNASGPPRLITNVRNTDVISWD